MKRVIIFCFSGTGNTEQVMAMLRDALHREGVHADCARIDQCVRSGVLPDISGYDAIGIGYPIFAFNVPGPVEAFVKMLPCGGGKPVFVFKTAGEPFAFNRTSSYFIHRKIARRGYDLAYERLFLMPYNIVFRYPDAVVSQIYTLSEKLAGRMAADIVRGVENRPRYNPFFTAVSWIMRIQQPGAALNGKLMRATKACNGCGKCVRECRTGNIRMEKGKIRFGWKCAMCMRCIMFCPQGAVKAGLLEPWAVRGAYDFKRILNDKNVPQDYIQSCKKGFFKYFQKYVSEVEALICDTGDDIEGSA